MARKSKLKNNQKGCETLIFKLKEIQNTGTLYDRNDRLIHLEIMINKMKEIHPNQLTQTTKTKIELYEKCLNDFKNAAEKYPIELKRPIKKVIGVNQETIEKIMQFTNQVNSAHAKINDILNVGVNNKNKICIARAHTLYELIKAQLQNKRSARKNQCRYVNTIINGRNYSVRTIAFKTFVEKNKLKVPQNFSFKNATRKDLARKDPAREYKHMILKDLFHYIEFSKNLSLNEAYIIIIKMIKLKEEIGIAKDRKLKEKVYKLFNI